MKYIQTTIFSLILMCNLSAQVEYKFEIETNTDSTFKLLVIEQLSEDRSKIEKFSNLDTAALQNRLYSDINASYEREARIEIEKEDERILRAELFGALNAQGINEYLIDKREQLDSFYVAPSYRYRSSNGADSIFTTVVNPNNLTLLRDSSNTNVAVIVPYSPNNVLLRFLPVGTLDVNLFSDNSRVFIGREPDGTRHVLVKRR